MNSLNQNDHAPNANAGPAEETLRLVASLPAPQGLEDRLKARLKAAPRNGKVLRWPSGSGGGNAWLRGTVARAAAAAAIVFVVAGGGWGVYSRVRPADSPKVIAMPERANAPGGFSNAGAMRTPQTLNGPVLAHPVKETPKQNDGDVKVVPMPKKAQSARGARSKTNSIRPQAR